MSSTKQESLCLSTKFQNESVKADETVDILNSVDQSNSSIFQKVISEEANSHKSFSINVN
jgi:hypothetical protein